ncbi:uncharacterized protein F5147DRAFT_691593 [Suillus discolor]|uniref:Uncharacterized protein n=1 Tax=Suillus discolor TaxID=1912936 RepID=A0A9P7F9N8_9AGAM|nr:uncharacterized protein F5147DRAFT_691593 [Suillus discolor]KAG2109624.1 hypothetical protein F5147DRAFT_691593 [Suillus discolor]
MVPGKSSQCPILLHCLLPLGCQFRVINSITGSKNTPTQRMGKASGSLRVCYSTWYLRMSLPIRTRSLHDISPSRKLETIMHI